LPIENKKDEKFISKFLKSGNIIHLPLDTYYISKTIQIPTDITINGGGSVLSLQSDDASIFNIAAVKKVTIKNFRFIASDINYDLDNYIARMEKPLINIENSSNIYIDSLSFENHTFTPLRIIDSEKLNIRNSHFNNIGKEYPDKMPSFIYNYDAIFIGCNENKYCSDIHIDNCNFNNIGNYTYHHKNDFSKNDGDGIQFQSKSKNSINGVYIENCVFNNCSSRGIKAQSGRSISIKNNKFNNCRSGIGLTQETPLSEINILDNNFDSCNIAIAINHNFTVNDILIKNNTFKNINFGIRTSGGSNLKNVNIENNKAYHIISSFFDGEATNLNFMNNQIRDFASGGDKDYYMGILFAGRSENIIFKNNLLETKYPTNTAIYINETVKNINLEKNEINLSKSINNKNLAIYSHSKDGKNIIKDNAINLIK
jgi:hypothetical protein